jgi:hypothetical protein
VGVVPPGGGLLGLVDGAHAAGGMGAVALGGIGCRVVKPLIHESSASGSRRLDWSGGKRSSSRFPVWFGGAGGMTSSRYSEAGLAVGPALSGV